MPAPIVRTNHDELKQIGVQFGQEADAAQKLLQSLRQHKDTLANGGWKGKGAIAFLREMDTSILPSLANLHRALQQAQHVTTRISARLRQAEQDAAAVLQDRTELNANPADSGASGAPGGDGGGGFLSQVGGFFKGIGLGAWDTVTGLWQAVTNPVDTIKGLAYAVTHPGELWDAITTPYREAWARGDYGEAIGRGTFEALSMIFPPGGGAAAKGAAKAADVAGDVARVANVASDVARGADLAGDAARIAIVAEDAAGIAHVADQAADAGRMVQSGAAYRRMGRTFRDEFDLWEVYAPRAYDEIRNTDDIADIARHSGMSDTDIAQIKNHVFFDEHPLDDGIRRFDPNPDMADAWQRLQNGTHIPSDIDLLRHELYESNLMRTTDMDYRTAHNATVEAGYTWDPPATPTDLGQ